mgnify:CR=1 FL=1
MERNQQLLLDNIDPSFIMDKHRVQKLKEVETKLLEGRLRTFLRRFRPYYYNENIHHSFIKKNKSEPKFKIGLRWLRKQTDWPVHQSQIINILRLLVKWYGEDFNKKGFKRAYTLWLLIWDYELSDYFKKDWLVKVKNNNLKLTTPEKAFKEHKARGFIHVNDYEDYDRDAAHVFSNVNRDYVYPQNFSHGVFKTEYKWNIYIGHYCVGVKGYTRTEIPK